MVNWLVFVLWTVFAGWVIFGNGAEEVEGLLASILTGDWMAYFLSPTNLRLYVFVLWLGQLIFIVMHH